MNVPHFHLGVTNSFENGGNIIQNHFIEEESSEDDDDLEDVGDPVVYSCTLGDNFPVLIKSVKPEKDNIEDVPGADESCENDDILNCEPIESNLIIAKDGMISEINTEMPLKQPTLDDISNEDNNNVKTEQSNDGNIKSKKSVKFDNVEDEQEADSSSSVCNRRTNKFKDAIFACFKCMLPKRKTSNE